MDGFQWIPCAGCKMLDFNVLFNPIDGLAHVICRSCGIELLAGQVAVPKEQIAVQPI